MRAARGPGLMRALPFGLLLVLVACSGTGEQTRRVHIEPRATEPSTAKVVCVEPVVLQAAQMTSPAAPLYRVCKGFQAGAVTAEEYRHLLADFPAILIKAYALDRLDHVGAAAATPTKTLSVELSRLSSYRVLCRFAGPSPDPLLRYCRPSPSHHS